MTPALLACTAHSPARLACCMLHLHLHLLSACRSRHPLLLECHQRSLSCVLCACAPCCKIEINQSFSAHGFIITSASTRSPMTS
jgi:hypothetical protein